MLTDSFPSSSVLGFFSREESLPESGTQTNFEFGVVKNPGIGFVEVRVASNGTATRKFSVITY